MNDVLEKPETEYAFSAFPQEMDDYFANNSIEIKILPEEFLPSLEKRHKNIKITNAKQFSMLLDGEIAFWREKDPDNKLLDFSKFNSLVSAKQRFDSSKNDFEKNQTYSGRNSLADSVKQLKNGILYSKLTLAKYIVENLLDVHSDIIRGFKAGILKDKSINLSSTSGTYEGLLMAMQFRKVIDSLATPSEEEIAKFYDRVNGANEQYSELNSRYTQSFHEHDNMITEFVEKTNAHFEELHTKTEAYFKERDNRCSELEELYVEKLRLKAPAEYWKNLSNKYKVSGIHWMSASVFSALAIVTTLILTLINLPNLFSESSNWLVLFRNSAILTVITSVLVYLVRYFIKMAMSSFHLSRDARERENLSHFYLALIENGTVTEKERAIILNSLFSRSDSGLLKGDSSPTMLTNPSDLIDTLRNR